MQCIGYKARIVLLRALVIDTTTIIVTEASIRSIDTHQNSPLLSNQLLKLILTATEVVDSIGDFGSRVPLGNICGSIAVQFG